MLELMQETERKDYSDGQRRRVVQVYQDGIRAVTFQFGGESWHRYVIVPRKSILQWVRAVRSTGKRWNDFDRYELMPEMAFSSSGYSGPGCSFANEPHLLCKNRRYYVFCQRGGLDV